MESIHGITEGYVWPLAFIAGLLGIPFILAMLTREPAKSPKA